MTPVRPVAAVVCDTCPPEAQARCLRERLCWAAEMVVIRAEREARKEASS